MRKGVLLSMGKSQGRGKEGEPKAQGFAERHYGNKAKGGRSAGDERTKEEEASRRAGGISKRSGRQCSY